MSILTRTRRIHETYESAPERRPVPAEAISRHADEAPERAACPSEAPESRRGRWAEAPDAGESRQSHHDSDFTHGRSQS
jgi:hypothetical protein